MHVAVIGAGASGLAATRYLLDEGHNGFFTCEVYERNEAIGGTWFYTDDSGIDQYGVPVYACMYSGLITNLPKEVMAFSDYDYPEQDKSYITQEEVLAYLNSYANHFNLNQHIKLATMVTEVRSLTNDRWSLKAMDIRTKKETTKEFDAVILCSGHYNEGFLPEIPGRELFKGKQLHSHDFRKPGPFRDQRVLVIGARPSGLDVSLMVSDYAKSVILSHRADMKFQTKFPANITLKSEVTRITENGVEFEDGTETTIDTICYCTGYKYSYPYLHESCKITIDDFAYVTPLYKHIINIEHPTMCFIGIPYRACSLPMYDLQIRYYIEYLKGVMVLPNKQKMYEDTANDIAKRKKIGYTKKKQMQLMSDDLVWDYYKELSELAKIKNISPAVINLRMYSSKIAWGNLFTFRNNKYRIVDENNFEKVD